MAGTRRVTAAPGRVRRGPGEVLAPWLGSRFDGIEPAPVVACSGGPDSLALLGATVASGRAPTAVYVDHGLRPEAAMEASRVAAIAARWGIPARAVRVEVDPGPNLEARARRARYGALDAVRREEGAATVLVGHTADDQAETMLLNLLRGSAATGLGAMRERWGWVVRPFLDLRRHDCEAMCAALGLEPVRDPMNDDRGFRRTRVRHELLPLLADLADRDVVPVLARQAELLRTDADYLDALARAAWPPAPDATPARLLAELPLPLARRAIRQWVGPPPPTAAEVARVLAVARGAIRATELAGRRRIERRAGSLLVHRATVGP